jgi:hypothetical protein
MMLLVKSENLTPQPPSLQGKGEPESPSPLLLGVCDRLVTRLRPGNADLEAEPLFGAGGSASTHSIPRWNLGKSHLGGETPQSIRQQDHLLQGGL